MKLIATTIAAAIATASSPANAQQPTAEAVAKLGDSGFAQFQCAVLAGFGKQPTVDKHFNAGLSDMRQFLAQWRASDDASFRKEVGNKVPMIITMELGGPSIDFEIGRVYSAVLWYVDDGLRDRDTWLHQKKDPSAPAVEPAVVEMRAEQQYKDKNCALLAR
ncbi:hypothetical protein [Sphingopyxis sp. R3-92]|uniref:hypothetical protein n=1 Tax=Sphingopyxis sp. R3-92 TaxID=3158553 RepID=UPI003EE6BCE8